MLGNRPRQCQDGSTAAFADEQVPLAFNFNIMKFALITGCSQGGIGYALALELRRHPNIHVFATTRSVSKMDRLAGHPNVTLLALDVTSPASVDAAVAAVTCKTGGRLDYLVNNAGLQIVMPVLDLDIESARHMYEVNFWGVFAVTRAFAPLVIAAQGTIANLSSIGAMISLPYLGPFLLYPPYFSILE